ncbi:sulfite exporter TauE/SafE family protein [Hansschlegelia sp.]|uniref:sulfite exporter TauE/SafE family protein n=1 Tax=Hansschlegelia sp. TaxID=2041892 RepID=UPI002BD64030|nr:sulfite exporter TauE/SafE family protein [Hansschlegelia sp.]HVI27757.1 sulfite exporter TauE/SafE family protein [Hansschlegelia sp.]
MTLALAIAIALLSGVVRGFSGFGSALIFVPLISALYDPARATPVFCLIDAALMAPMALRAFRRCDWPEVAPMALTTAAFTPLGVYALVVVDPVTLRWAIAIAVAGTLALLSSGLRYAHRPPVAAALAVGAAAGVLGGSAQISGAPIAAYWLAGPGERGVIRANMIALFALVSFATFASLLWAGLLTTEVLWLCLWLGPAYGIGIFLGARRFVGATDAGYRRAAYAVILLAAALSAPVWDTIWR